MRRANARLVGLFKPGIVLQTILHEGVSEVLGGSPGRALFQICVST
jgi:hypothetical protein